MVTYHEHGGYTMDSNEIGVVLTVVGICQLLWQVTMSIIHDTMCVQGDDAITHLWLVHNTTERALLHHPSAPH